MPESAFDIRIRVNDVALNDALADAQRRLRNLNQEAARVAISGGDTTRIQGAIREERKIVASLRNQVAANERIETEARERTRLGRAQNRAQQRLNRVTGRLSEEIEKQRRAVIRSAVTLRALEDASPLVLARAGFGLLQGGIAAGLGGAGVAAGVATGVGAAAAAGAGILAAPTVIGLTGTEAAQSFEQVEALRNSLASLADLQGFAPTQQLEVFQDALRGTFTEAEALRTVIAIERLGIPELSNNLGDFSANVANVSAATGESFERIFRSVQRFISRGTFERIQDFLPNLDRDRVRALERGLSEVEQQAVRARAVMEALGEQADNTGRQFESGSQEATVAIRRYEAAIEALNIRWGEFAQEFVVDVRNTMTEAIYGLIDLWDQLTGRLTRTEVEANISLAGQTDEDLRDLLRLATQGDIGEIAQRTGLETRTVGRGARERLVFANTSLEDLIKNLNALLEIRSTPLDTLARAIESGDFSGFSFVQERATRTVRGRVVETETDFGVTGGRAQLESLLRIESERRRAQDRQVFATTDLSKTIEQLDRGIGDLEAAFPDETFTTTIADDLREGRLGLDAFRGTFRSGERAPVNIPVAFDVTDIPDGLEIDAAGDLSPSLSGATHTIQIGVEEAPLEGVGVFARERITEQELNAAIGQARQTVDLFAAEFNRIEQAFLAQGLSREQAQEEIQRRFPQQVVEFERAQGIVDLAPDVVPPQAMNDIQQLSDSIAFLSDTATSATSQLIFNARSIEDVFRGLLQELYQQAAPNFFQTALTSLGIGGLTRGG